MGLHTLRMISLRPKRCSSSHHSSTLAVGYASLRRATSSGVFFESLLLPLVGLGMAGPGDLRAIAHLSHILPAPLLLLAHRLAGPTLDPLAHLRRVPHPSVGRRLH